jgi:bacteriophage N4 adsorption protein B
VIDSTVVAGLGFVSHELMLFAAFGIVIGGVADIVIDLAWIGRAVWRRSMIYTRVARADAASLDPPTAPGLIAVFIPAWDEGAVIAPMLRHATATFRGGDWRIYVGAYPNDPDTVAAVVEMASPRIRLVIGAAQGPTTKADCLNTLWHALCADEASEGRCAKAVVLHDAEDVVHSAEIGLYDRLIERFALVQLPVLPLIDSKSRWIAGHYNDEFAEAHGKNIVVREAIGAAIPSAGTGCAFSRAVLGAIASQRGGAPFDADSLTEDYELGLRIAQMGGVGAFVRIPAAPGAPVVAVRAHFPATLDAAVRQKARWMVGIALSGWDRLGWRGGFAERLMRLHDRRALLAAIGLLAAYGALILDGCLRLTSWATGVQQLMAAPALAAMLWLCAVIMIWRLAMRAAFVTRDYGWREGLWSLPRALIGNVIAMMAARRAVSIYLQMRRDGVVRWDKTAHHFPATLPAE